MPIYFFHITEGDQVIADPEGIDRPDIAAVQKTAIESAHSLISEAVRSGDRSYQGRFDVVDEHGNPVLTLTFACPIQIEMTLLPELAMLPPQADANRLRRSHPLSVADPNPLQ